MYITGGGVGREGGGAKMSTWPINNEKNKGSVFYSIIVCFLIGKLFYRKNRPLLTISHVIVSMSFEYFDV